MKPSSHYNFHNQFIIYSKLLKHVQGVVQNTSMWHTPMAACPDARGLRWPVHCCLQHQFKLWFLAVHWFLILYSTFLLLRFFTVRVCYWKSLQYTAWLLWFYTVHFFTVILYSTSPVTLFFLKSNNSALLYFVLQDIACHHIFFIVNLRLLCYLQYIVCFYDFIQYIVGYYIFDSTLVSMFCFTEHWWLLYFYGTLLITMFFTVHLWLL